MALLEVDEWKAVARPQQAEDPDEYARLVLRARVYRQGQADDPKEPIDTDENLLFYLRRVNKLFGRHQLEHQVGYEDPRREVSQQEHILLLTELLLLFWQLLLDAPHVHRLQPTNFEEAPNFSAAAALGRLSLLILAHLLMIIIECWRLMIAMDKVTITFTLVAAHVL